MIMPDIHVKNENDYCVERKEDEPELNVFAPVPESYCKIETSDQVNT